LSERAPAADPGVTVESIEVGEVVEHA